MADKVVLKANHQLGLGKVLFSCIPFHSEVSTVFFKLWYVADLHLASKLLLCSWLWQTWPFAETICLWDTRAFKVSLFMLALNFVLVFVTKLNILSQSTLLWNMVALMTRTSLGYFSWPLLFFTWPKRCQATSILSEPVTVWTQFMSILSEPVIAFPVELEKQSFSIAGRQHYTHVTHTRFVMSNRQSGRICLSGL